MRPPGPVSSWLSFVTSTVAGRRFGHPPQQGTRDATTPAQHNLLLVSIRMCSHLVGRGPALEAGGTEVVLAQHLDAALDAQMMQRVRHLQPQQILLQSQLIV